MVRQMIPVDSAYNCFAVLIGVYFQIIRQVVCKNRRAIAENTA
jgi:hypothetical protein